MFLIIVYFKGDCWVKGNCDGFNCWLMMWWVFGRFCLISKRIFIDGFNGCRFWVIFCKCG